ncbi:GLPK5-like protein [Mya arenaria]|uniref:GLPK5-like protein n=1 Tax=Mya arenaria TaxID=6604 RepID=A0ABY7G521_MYAAR|nr:GLPK5-like protein [Mya arenaria]
MADEGTIEKEPDQDVLHAAEEMDENSEVDPYIVAIDLLRPKPGWVEMDPEHLFQQFLDCVSESIKVTHSCISRETEKPYHNFITWQDMRARDYVKSWNDSVTLKALNSGSKILHTFTRKKRFLSASVLKFMSPQVTLRLLWCLDNIPELRKRASAGQVMFGCIETWILWRLTKGKVHATDYSCASGTGLYDPFQVEWSTIVCGLVNIPMNIFPEVGDQSASMFGECCFEVGDIKCTLGTGMFMDVNTGSQPHASVAGLYPLIGWKIGDKLTYLAEGLASDTGTVIQWAQSMGYFDDVRDTAAMAESVEDTGGVYFVPAFSGLQAPINDDKACTTMLGMTPNTTKAHIVRAILESICFRFKLLYETVLTEMKIPLNVVRVNGGVCNNDFVVQLMADLTNHVINRSRQTEYMTSLGTAFFAGLATGVWKNQDELVKIRKTDREFSPRENWATYKNVFHQWERAVSRSRQWTEET